MADGGRGENNDGADKESDGNFDIQKYLEQLKPEFKKLNQKDEYLPAVLAYRAALRCFPLIVENKYFDFWGQKTKLRSLYILSHYEMLLLISRVCLHQSNADMIQLNHIRATVDPDSSASTPVYATADAIADIYSDIFSETSHGLYALYSVAEAVNIAYVNSYNIFNKLIDCSERDINFANTHILEELMAQPIWPSGIPDDFVAIYKTKFKPAVIALADEQPDKSIADALLKILADYESRVQLGDVDENLTQIISPEVSAENDSLISDALNRDGLVSALENKFTHNSNSGHLTVGLLGHWGSGKTRILNLLKGRLINKKSQFIWGEFNAWAYEHTENIQAGMAHEIIQALTQNPIIFDEEKERKSIVDAINNKSSKKAELTVDDHSNWVEWKLHLRQSKYALSNLLVWQLFRKLLIAGGFVARKHPFKMTLFSVITVITVIIGIYVGTGIISDERTPLKDLIAGDAAAFGVFGTFSALLYWINKNIKQVFAQPYTKELLTYVKLPSYSKHLGLVSEMRKDIKLLCKQRLQRGLFKSEKRMVFVVDDLDRCSPDGIVKTLEAVRLILDIENVTVIVAVDQRIALAALAYHYQEIQDFHTSGDARTIARDYLGKIIHLPINIPEPDIETVKGYMGYVWQNDEDDSGELDWRQLVLPEDKAKMEQRDNSDERPKQPSEEQQDLDSGKDTDSEKDSDKKFTVEEVAQLILEEPLPEAVKPKPESILKGLTPEQKAAFVYWTDQFQLTNPRQLKRLHNSYNLLQLVSEKIDKIISDKHHLAFGYLVTLIALEFINNQLDLRLARELKDYLFSCKTDDEDTPIGETPEALKPLNDDNLIGACRNAREVICAAAEVLVSYDSNHSKLSVLFSLVNAFVLPAIEVANAKSVKFENGEVKT